MTTRNKKLAALLAVGVVGALSQPAAAFDGKITFTGEIADLVCSVSPASQDQTVPLGKVALSQLNGAAGKVATPAYFTIDLLDCGATAKGAKVKFDGTTDAVKNEFLRVGIGELSPATGVAIELGDSSANTVPVGSYSGEYKLAPGPNPLKFQARYVSTGDKVTVGAANAVAQFTIQYQ